MVWDEFFEIPMLYLKLKQSAIMLEMSGLPYKSPEYQDPPSSNLKLHFPES